MVKGKGRKTILLVEDEAVNARLTGKILEKNGYRVINAYSGEEAVEITGKEEKIDLILMDIDMGEGIDGTSAASLILSRRDIPLVFLSSHSEPEFVKKTEEITSYGYVLKNSGETVLLASINMALKLYYANRKIIENETKLNALLSNITDVVVIIDKSGIVKYKSRNIEKWFGWEPEELTGRHSLENVHPLDQSLAMDLLTSLAGQTGKSGTIESRYKCKDGTYKWTEITIINLLDNPVINGFLGNFRDITEQKKFQENLQAAEEKYRTLFINSQIGIFRTDVVDGTVLEANDRFARLLGFRNRDELFAESIPVIDFYTDKKVRYKMIDLLQKDGEVINYEAQLKRRDGSFFWIRYSASLFREKGWLEGVVEDITDLKRAEKERSVIYNELLASEKKYRLIFEASPFGLFYINNKGVIIDCNEAFIRLTGLPWSGIVGINLFELPDKEVMKAAEKLLNGIHGNYEGDYQVIKSNRKIPVHIVYEPVYDSNGLVAGGVVIVEDITEKRITQRGVLDELEKERSRIAHILHDSLGQKLGAALYLVQAFQRKYRKTGSLSDDDLGKLSGITSSALEETRNLSRGLDIPLESAGFIELLNDISRKTTGVYGIAVETSVDEAITGYDSIKLLNLYYIILESVNNAVKHGRAEKIVLKYNSSEEENIFTIESSQNRAFKIENPGMGLRIMKYRADVSGMGFSIAAKGKRVIVTVDLGENNIILKQ